MSVVRLTPRPQPATPPRPPADVTRARQLAVVHLQLNGDPVALCVPSHWTLLEMLRYQAGLVGTKQGCDKGDCGTCTVRLDGDPVLACIVLAAECDGRAVETVEGLGVGGEPHPLMAAFARTGAAQCGFCTPGMLVSAAAWLDSLSLDDHPLVRRDEIAHMLGGNLCRCTGYTKILDAVEQAAHEVLARSRTLSGTDAGEAGRAA
jgi:aerobic-type carbon monoxide dehydrogenase small subunit (CoxS/CutS family)